MATDFGSGNSTRRIDFAVDTGLNLPNADWGLVAMVNVPVGRAASPEAHYGYMFSTGTFGTANGMHMYYGEDDGTAPDPNAWLGRHEQTLVVNVDIGNVDDGVWRVVALRRTGTDVTVAFVDLDGTSVTSSTAATQAGFAVAPGLWRFGARGDATPNVDRFYKGQLEWFFSTGPNSTTVTDAHLIALAQHLPPQQLANELDLAFIGDFGDPANPIDIIGARTPTISGTGYVQVDGPINIRGRSRIFTPFTVAGEPQLAATNSSVSTETADLTIPSVGEPQLAGNVTAVSSQSADLTLGDLAFIGVALAGDNINEGSSTITLPASSTPTVRMVPYTTSTVNGSGNDFWFFQGTFTGCASKTPTFEVAGTSRYHAAWASLNMQYSEDGKSINDRTKTWSYFDNVSFPGDVLTCSNTGAFTGDTVTVAYGRPIVWGQLDDWLDNVWDGDALIQETGSSTTFGGAKYQFATAASDTDINGRSVPAQNHRCFFLTDLATSPDDGQGKRDVLLVSGLHASEDLGTENWIAAINFLLAADAGGTADQQAAARLVKNFRFWCSAWVNPGRIMHHDRGYAIGSSPHEDPNRAWDESPNVPFITTVKDAYEADVGAFADASFDLHSQGGATNNYESYVNAKTGAHDAFQLRLDTYVTFGELTSSWPASTQDYSTTTYNALVATTMEINDNGLAYTTTETDAFARAMLRSLDDIYVAEFEQWAATDTAISSESANLTIPSIPGTVELAATNTAVSNQSATLGGVVLGAVGTGGGSSMSIQRMRELERIQMIRRDDEQTLKLLSRLLR